MLRTMLRSKLHRVTITHTELDYEGSVAIDGLLLDAADMREYERVDIYNVNNGERFSTYTMRAQEGSGIVSLNGAAARKASRGDVVIICSYVGVPEEQLAGYKPRLVYVDAANRVRGTRSAIPAQMASVEE